MLKYVYKNTNPKGKETADCVTRALVLATGISYEEVVTLQTNYSLETGESFANKVVYEKILKKYGYTKYKQPKRADGTMYCIGEMDEILTDDQLLCGVFVTVNSHVSFIKGKNYYDIWDCGDCCVRNYYVKNYSSNIKHELLSSESDLTNKEHKGKITSSNIDKNEPIQGSDLDKERQTVIRYHYEKTIVNTAEEFIRLVIEENFAPGALVVTENVKNKVLEIVKAKLPEKKKSIITYLYIWIKTGSWSNDNNFNEIIDDLIDMAKSGMPMAQNTLGYCYDNGYGVGQSNVEAATWFKKAAEQGYAVAQCNLGNCYSSGDFGIGQSYSKAAYWYEKAAKQGYAAAQKCFGDCFYYGDGEEQSYSKAVFWYTKSAEQGNEWAQYWLGQCYRWGDGVEQSYEKAVEWYKKSAAQGNVEAKDSLDSIKESETAEKNYIYKSSNTTAGKNDKTYSNYKSIHELTNSNGNVGISKMMLIYSLFIVMCVGIFFMVKYDFANMFGNWFDDEISYQPHMWAHWGLLGKSSLTELLSAPGSEMIFFAWPICIIGFIAEIIVWLFSYAIYGLLWGLYGIFFGVLWALQHFLFLAGFIIINVVYFVKLRKNTTRGAVKIGYFCLLVVSTLITGAISIIIFAT